MQDENATISFGANGKPVNLDKPMKFREIYGQILKNDVKKIANQTNNPFPTIVTRSVAKDNDIEVPNLQRTHRNPTRNTDPMVCFFNIFFY